MRRVNIRAFRANISNEVKDLPLELTIDGKIVAVLCTPGKTVREKKIEIVKESGINDNKLAEANDRLMEIRKEKGVSEPFFSPQPKAK